MSQLSDKRIAEIEKANRPGMGLTHTDACELLTERAGLLEEIEESKANVVVTVLKNRISDYKAEITALKAEVERLEGVAVAVSKELQGVIRASSRREGTFDQAAEAYVKGRESERAATRRAETLEAKLGKVRERCKVTIGDVVLTKDILAILDADKKKVTVEEAKELRERTGGGIVDCKKTLERHQGDMDAAELEMRSRGNALAALDAKGGD